MSSPFRALTSTPRARARAIARLLRAHPRPPVRIAHLGLGAFHRAHQAVYIARAADGADWGIRAFTGHGVRLPALLAAQDCLYTVVQRGPDRDQLAVGTALADARPGGDIAAWRAVCRDPRTSLITLTVTEAGYHLRGDGRLNRDDPAVRADLTALSREARSREALSGDSARVGAAPATTIGRLALGLLDRYHHGGRPLVVVSCDNIAGNGTRLRAAMLEFAAGLPPGLATWMERHVAFPSSVVDRITPATTSGDIAVIAAATGIRDEAAVITEPASEWVLEDLPAGPARDVGLPDLRSAGVTITADPLPFEQRKLWMLNGAHTLLAYAGLLRGHATIAQAFADPLARRWAEEWWDAASRHVRLPADSIEVYRRELTDRFANPRIQHLVTQVAMDPLAKLAVRVLPVLRRELASGRLDAAAVRPVAAWLAVTAVTAGSATAGATALTADRVRAALRQLDPECAADDQVVALTRAEAMELQALARSK
jgi:fructuronate reductase